MQTQVRPSVALAPTPPVQALGAAPARHSTTPPRQLGGRGSVGDDGDPPNRPQPGAYQGGAAVVPRVGSVFDEVQQHAGANAGYLDKTYEGLAQVPSGRSASSLTAGIKQATERARSTVRGWPRRVQLGVAGGLAVLLIVVIAIAVSSSGGSAKQPAAAGTKPTPTSTGPLIAVTSFHDKRGIDINVPRGWHKASTSNYTDFTDPTDSSRKIRINVESSSNDTPAQFLGVAERGLKNPSRCTSPYQRVSLTSITLNGHPGGVLEYTCGSGTGKRHGIWAATTLNGKAYHFYLTVPDSEFASSKIIFNEMVRSFKLTAPAV